MTYGHNWHVYRDEVMDMLDQHYTRRHIYNEMYDRLGEMSYPTFCNFIVREKERRAHKCPKCDTVLS